MNAAVGKKPQPLRVLIAEDSRDDAELILACLRRCGTPIQADVVATLEEFRLQAPLGYDVVLCDYNLRDWTGMEALRLVQQLKDPPPFILVSGTIGEDKAVRCLKQGVADFVLKSRLELLPEAIERALEETAARRRQEGEEEDLRRAMIEAIPAFVWTAKPNGWVDYCNQKWCEYSGLSLEASCGWGWRQALHPEDASPALERWKDCLRTGAPYEVEYRLQRADGEYRWFLGRAVALRHGKDVVKWFGTCTDIQDGKKAHEALAQLIRLRDDLVANVSHALRTPLASLRGFSELLLTRDFPEEKRREFLTIIHQTSKRLTEIINRFLDLQRMESGRQGFRFEPLDLAELIREQATAFAVPAASHRLRLELEVPLPAVVADAGRIRELLNNLISNAIKYSPRGGEVVIGARGRGPEVLLWVADRGLGIPEHAMPHLFEKFYRVEDPESSEIGGTGLGLALVKQIAECHGGRAWAESVHGEGSTFTVALPRERSGMALVSSPRSASAAAGAGEAAPVLLVEDDAAFARMLTEHLEHRGFKTRHTPFAEQALEWCRSTPPAVILLDVHLAGAMDGWDLLLALKNDHRLQHIAIIVLVGSDPHVHGLALSGAEYALKSSSSDALHQAVLRQLPTLAGKHVLVADDDPVFRARLSRLLRNRGVEVEEACDGAESLRRMKLKMPDLLVLDLLMPELDGFEVLRRLRNERRAVNLRIVVVTAKDLQPSEKAYLTRKLASLVGKDEPRLEHFSEAVARVLQPQAEIKAAAAR